VIALNPADSQRLRAGLRTDDAALADSRRLAMHPTTVHRHARNAAD
jgi:hypothetical protein